MKKAGTIKNRFKRPHTQKGNETNHDALTLPNVSYTGALVRRLNIKNEQPSKRPTLGAREPSISGAPPDPVYVKVAVEEPP